MFWGSFTYDRKGPIHIYKAEIKKQKEHAEKELNKLNKEREPELRTQWELGPGGVARIGLRNKPGRKPQWKFIKTNSKLVREGKGGIDFWRYLTEVVDLHLLLFAQECLQTRPGILLVEDGAPCHKHFYTQELWTQKGIPKLEWPGNSPDLNAIEPAWGYLKRKSTDRGLKRTAAALARRWRGE